MGLEASQAAFRESYRLGEKHAAARLLLWMAFHVLDRPQNGREALTYWADYLTAAIGLGYPPSETVDADRAQAAITAVKRNLRALQEAGLIVRVGTAGRGRNAVWRLTLDLAQPVDNRISRSARGGHRGSKTDRLEVEDRLIGGRTPTPLEVEDRSESGRRPTPLSVRPGRPGGPEVIGTRTRAHDRRRSA